jgi:ATP-dependent DNA ligase
MEAESAKSVPQGPEWQYEPKWDGFRCLAFRDGPAIELQSKAGQALARYFPEVVEAVAALRPKRCVLDGEIVVPTPDGLSFDDLLQRIHPAESRIRKLAQSAPGLYVVFDLLVDEHGRDLTGLILAERRERLEAFAAANFSAEGRVRLSPATPDFEHARGWLRGSGGGLDGVIAKRRDCDYRSGERGTGMLKIKFKRTADCVVGGFRYAEKARVVGSLLLGLYDEDGTLNHVGFTSGIKAADRPALTAKLEKLIEPPGFTGRSPGGPSRWSTARSAEWQPLASKLVVEVEYDHFSGGRFRHGTRLVRWRPDKAPRQCTMQQVEQESGSPLGLLDAA